jgi:hypothetical protein
MKSFEGADELRGTPKHDRVMPCVLFEHPAHLGVTIATSIDGEIRRPLRRLPSVSTPLVHCLLALPPHPPSRCDALPRVEVKRWRRVDAERELAAIGRLARVICHAP